MDKLKLDIETLLKENDLYSQPLTDKEQAIITAAEDLFSHVGYNNAPTAEIAKRAKVTERTLFKYFPTKQLLLRRILFPIVLKTIFPTQIRKAKGLLQAPYSNYKEFCKTMYTDRLEMVSVHGGKIKILMLELLQNEKFKKQIVQLWSKHIWNDIVSFIEKMKSEGKIRTDIKSDTAARANLFMIMGYVIYRHIVNTGAALDDNKEIELLSEILSNGLSKK